METIRGIVSTIRPQDVDEDTGRVYFAMQVETPSGLVSAYMGGYYRGLREGDSIGAEAEWRDRPASRTGGYYDAKSIRPELPLTALGVERFLNAVLETHTQRFGVTTSAVAALVKRHGPQVAHAAVQQPGLVHDLSSDTRKFGSALVAEWKSRTQGMEAVSFMEQSGIKIKVIERIIANWQTNTLERLMSDPYQAAHIPNVGFLNADLLGRRLGISLVDRRRLTACVSEVLAEQEKLGSTYADIDTLLMGMTHVSGVTGPVLTSFLREASERRDHDLALFDTPAGPICAHVSLYNSEVKIVTGVLGLKFKGKRESMASVQRASAQMFTETRFKRFDAVQQTAVEMAASEPISIITGGPGTGKSAVMDAVVEMVERLGTGPVFLAGPTGMSAKRLAQATSRAATTMHLLLRAKGGEDTKTEFAVNENSKLPQGSTVVVDETSMLDVELMAALMRAMPSNGRLILVGDKNQLPSVGPGAVLRDLLCAEIDGRPVVPSVELRKVYRQGKNSAIATGATLVCQGRVPMLSPQNVNGVSFAEVETRFLADRIVRLVCEELPSLGFDAIRDVAILCPQKNGPCGTWDLNTRLQAKLNPSGKSLPGVARGPDDNRSIPVPLLGDRVMLTKNDADKGVMNGDIGTVVGSGFVGGSKRNSIKVQFDSGQCVEIPAARWRSLILAYAGTIHKSQGSQYRVVVMPFSASHGNMLERTLVYTGWTRAQERLCLLGEMAALEAGVTTYKGADRLTLVAHFLRNIRADAAFPAGTLDWRVRANKAHASMGELSGLTASPPVAVVAQFPVGVKVSPMASRFSMPRQVAPLELLPKPSPANRNLRPPSTMFSMGGVGPRKNAGKVNDANVVTPASYGLTKGSDCSSDGSPTGSVGIQTALKVDGANDGCAAALPSKIPLARTAFRIGLPRIPMAGPRSI